MKNETISYLFFGVLTTAVNILCYALLTKILNMDYIVANVLAWVIAVLFAFFTNKLFVFKSHHTSFNELIRELSSFLFFRVLSLLLDIGVMVLLIEYIKANDLIAKVLANVVVIIFNYIASKYIIFAQKEKKSNP